MIYFISDLHLSPQTPGATQILLNFLVDRARPGDALYILGDLFEVWIGDDSLQAPNADPFHRRVIDALRTASDRGLALHFLHGNRDFLLGPDFATATGGTLIHEPYLLSTASWQFVLAHGDAQCTDDLPYMAFRQQVRDPAWQNAFLARPYAEREAIARQMRERSQADQADKASPLSDLHPGTTEDFLRQQGYATFIHGHTHQAACHDHIVDGIHVERWVLGDWHEDRGDVLIWDEQTLRREILH